MSLVHADSFLRRVLLADAATSAVCGLVMMLGTEILQTLLGVPATLLRYAGLVLLPFAALVAWIGTRDSLSRPAVWAVIASNVLWALESLVLLITGPFTPTALGAAFIVLHALVVAAFAEAEYVGLRRSVAIAA
jgi:hypothetical protein